LRLLIDTYEVLVDDEDTGLISKYSWRIAKKDGLVQYAKCTINGYDTLLMHRLIMDAQPGELVDHINGNGLDNRRANLRRATPAEQQYNKRVQKKRATIHSQFKGVSWVVASQKWKAQIHKDYRSIHLGTFDTEEDAAMAYDKAATELFGEFARTNRAKADVT
jgi:hypothetical protein